MPTTPPPPRPSHFSVRTARRIVVAVVGATVVTTGVAMLVLPGPGVVVILAGLGILSLEFAFAKNWIAYVQARSSQAADRAAIPKRWRWAFPALAACVTVVTLAMPFFVSVVHGPGGIRLVHKPTMSYRFSFVSHADLQAHADAGDTLARGILDRCSPGGTLLQPSN